MAHPPRQGILVSLRASTFYQVPPEGEARPPRWPGILPISQGPEANLNPPPRPQASEVVTRRSAPSQWARPSGQLKGLTGPHGQVKLRQGGDRQWEGGPSKAADAYPCDVQYIGTTNMYTFMKKL